MTLIKAFRDAELCFPLKKYCKAFYPPWYIYIYISKEKLVTVVEGDPKAPFQQLLQGGVDGGVNNFLVYVHFTLDTYFIMLSVKQGCIKY